MVDFQAGKLPQSAIQTYPTKLPSILIGRGLAPISITSSQRAQVPDPNKWVGRLSCVPKGTQGQRTNESASANEQRKQSFKVLTQVAVLSHFLFPVCFGWLAVLPTCPESMLATSYLHRIAVHIWCPRLAGAGTHVNDIHPRGLMFLGQTRPYEFIIQWLDYSETSEILLKFAWPFANGVLDTKQLTICCFLC